MRESQLANAFAEAVRHAEAPVLDLNVVAKYLFSEYVSGAGFKVLLTGEGADEHFAGYHFFRADFLRAVDETVDPSLRWSETLRYDHTYIRVYMVIFVCIVSNYCNNLPSYF